jgi:hypothetical protein
MAQKGRGKKVRFQGGTVFPVAVAAVMILGVALVAYSRSSSYADAPGPRASDRDHYHIAFGIYKCDQWLPNVVGNREQGDEEYLAYGVHSHDDGVIHYHPVSGAASGRNAKLGVYLNVYDIELKDDKVIIPSDQPFAETLEEGVTKCKDSTGKEVDGQLKVAVWDAASDPSKNTILTANMDDARITKDGMAMAIYYVPADLEVLPEPPTASQLAELGAVDGGTNTPDVPTTVGTGTTVAGSGTTVAGSVTTVAGATETSGAAPDTSAASPDTTG